MDKITITLSPEQINDAIEGLQTAACAFNNIAKMWSDIADNEVDPQDLAIARNYSRQQKEKAAAMDDLADLFNRAYYAI